MPPPPPPRARLEAAYRATAYRVGPLGGPVEVEILVGEVPEGLGDAPWAFLTAWNPWSRAGVARAENDRRQEALRAALRARGLAWREGWGVPLAAPPPGSPAWAPEASLLVTGLPRAAAVALARRFEQHALVVGAAGGPAELVWPADEPPAG